jgi:hypothetical protein
VKARTPDAEAGQPNSLRIRRFRRGSPIAVSDAVTSVAPIDRPPFRFGPRLLRFLVAGCLLLLLVVASFRVGQASERDETTLTVEVSAADHELEEGYFSLGESAAVMVKPGTDLFRFLSSKRGHSVRITLSDPSRPAPSTLER